MTTQRRGRQTSARAIRDSLLRLLQIWHDGQITLLLFIRIHVKSSTKKYSTSVFRKDMIVSAHPASARGAIANVTNARRAAMDARGPSDERRAGGRAKSRGPDLPTLGSSLSVQSAGDGG
jgi:hypothetical protein